MEDKPKSTFKQNIVVHADDGNYYLIKKDEWHNAEHMLPSIQIGQMEKLVNQGVILAAVPDELPGVGSICYLVDIASIKTK